MFDWHEHEEALDEFAEAAEWYEANSTGWGEIFIDAVDTAIRSIRDPIIRWGFYGDEQSTPQLYSRSITGFPYDVIFLLINGEIYVVAYAHERRKPEYWAHRVEH